MANLRIYETSSEQLRFELLLKSHPTDALFSVLERNKPKSIGKEQYQLDTILGIGRALGSRASLDAYDQHGFPLVIRAVQYSLREKDTSVLEELIREGMPLKATDPSGATPLMWCAFSGNELLLDYMLSIPAFRQTINKEDKITRKTALEYSVDINLNAVRLRNFRKLIEAGAEPNHTNSSHTSLLMKMANRRQTKMVSVLLEYPSVIENINAKDDKGNTAIIYAVMAISGLNIDSATDALRIQSEDYKPLAMIKKLTKYGADPEIANKEEKNALFYAKSIKSIPESAGPSLRDMVLEALGSKVYTPNAAVAAIMKEMRRSDAVVEKQKHSDAVVEKQKPRSRSKRSV